MTLEMEVTWWGRLGQLSEKQERQRMWRKEVEEKRTQNLGILWKD